MNVDLVDFVKVVWNTALSINRSFNFFFSGFPLNMLLTRAGGKELVQAPWLSWFSTSFFRYQRMLFSWYFQMDVAVFVFSSGSCICMRFGISIFTDPSSIDFYFMGLNEKFGWYSLSVQKNSILLRFQFGESPFIGGPYMKTLHYWAPTVTFNDMNDYKYIYLFIYELSYFGQWFVLMIFFNKKMALNWFGKGLVSYKWDIK